MGGPASLCLLAALLACFPAASYSQLYSLITPNVLRVESKEKILVEAHGLNRPTEVTVTVFDFPQKKEALYWVNATLNQGNGMMATLSIKTYIAALLEVQIAFALHITSMKKNQSSQAVPQREWKSAAYFQHTLGVCKDPPYKVEESGYAGFILPIEVYFKNKEEPKKVRFDYDLFLHLEGHPPVNHLRCEKLTFNNPTEEFRRKLLRAGGIMVMSDGSSAASGQSLHLPNLPSNSLSFSEVKKKSSHGPKDPTKSISTSSSSSSNSFSKPHKLTKEHKERPSKDSKDHKSAFKEPSREHNKSSKESSKKPKENKPLKDEKIVPKMAFKEPKPMSKEPKSENNILTITGGQQQEKKVPTKRPPGVDSEDLAAKKRKKSGSETLFKSFSSAPPLILTCSAADKKQVKDKSQFKVGKVKMESETLEKKKTTLPPFDDIVDPNDSDMEENMSSKSESEQPSPASSSSSSSSSFTPSQNSRQQGPLRSIMKDLHSDDNEDESDEADENDNDSEIERPVNTHGGSRGRRVSLSDGSDSDSSSASSPLRHEPPPLLKTNSNQILEVKSPVKQSKSDKQIKNGDCDKAYLDELVELHRRLMTLRERHVLQQIVNLIEETGHFHITNTTFDFDLCSLDKTTVRKLQSYLETSGAS